MFSAKSFQNKVKISFIYPILNPNSRYEGGKEQKVEMVYVQSGILLSHRKEWNFAICKDMDETRVYHAK